MKSSSCSQADPLVANVVLAVVFSQKHISQDPKTIRGLESHEAGEADGLTALFKLEHVVVPAQGVVLASESESDDREAVVVLSKVLSLALLCTYTRFLCSIQNTLSRTLSALIDKKR